MHQNLRQFIQTLRQERDIVEISAPVDPYLELAEIHRRIIAEEGPALLFTNVIGSPFPVVTNLFGTLRRVALAFGPRPELLVKRAVSAMHTLVPPTPKALWQERGLLFDLWKVGTKTVPANAAPILSSWMGPEQEPMRQLPVITSWQEDGGPFVTLPLVYTEHPETREHNLGMYRMHVYNGAATGIHWQIHKGGGFHHFAAEQKGQALPVTVFLGGPPALIASAIAPVPENVPELLLTSLILGDRLPLVDHPLGGHRLVAEAEFAIEGLVPPHVRRPEGPFGDHYGYYSLVHDFPVLDIQRVWHRPDAIYPATVVGKPKQEDYYLGDFLQSLLSPLFPLAMPGVRDLWTYAETGFHPLAAAVVRESYSREALGTAFRILGEGQLTLTKVLLVTDRPVRLESFPDLLTVLLERFDPRTDLYIFNKTSHDTLDYTGDRLNHGSKAVFIGVGDPIRTLPRGYDGEAGALPGVVKTAAYSPGCLVVSGPTYEEEPNYAERMLPAAREKLAEWPLIVIADDAEAAVQNQTSFLWTVFTRFNPAADMYAESTVERHHLHYQLPIIVDARMKPGYPDELFPLEDIVKKVDERWREYFPKGGAR
jgi:UbiD family decarboxylase